MRLRSLIGLSTLAIATAAAAQQQDAPFVPALSQGLRQGVTLEQYLQQVMAPFRRAAGRDGVLTREAIVTLTATQETSARQQALLLLIELDADRDGTVAAAEIGAARSRPGSRTAARFAESLLTGGKESLSILDVYRNQSLPVPALGLETGVVTSLESLYAGYLALGDGAQVTAAKVIEKATDTFRAIDADGNTTISEQEFANAKPRISKARFAQPPDAVRQPDCTFPAPSAAAETVLLGAYEGDAMASVYVGDPHEETTTSNIVVQPGKAPLYIVAASYEPQIWAVSGAVERVEKFIVAAPQAGERSGVAGLPKDRVAFGGAYGRPCISYFYKSGTNETANARRAFAQAVGEEADRVGGAYSLSSVSVPEIAMDNLAPRGVRQPAPAGFDQATWREALRFAPRGLVRFDPSEVVSLTPARSYEVLPQQVGLAQLVFTGHLERKGGVYRIAKPIPHFPAGLNGAHSVTFVLGNGVPMPGGKPGHSCVRAEQTGEPIQPSARCGVSRKQMNPEGSFK